jgi:hypothetical protein
MRRQRLVKVLVAATALSCATLLAVTGIGQAAVGRASAGSGAWGKAIEVPGTGALNKGGNAFVNSVSCASAGNCAAVGPFTDRSGHHQVFVAGERNGAWHPAIEVPGTATLNKGNADVLSVSCVSAGNCAVGGSYADGSGRIQAFVASERNGAWQPAIEVPGTAALNKDREAGVASVSCVPAGNCAVAGHYTDGPGDSQAFVASERNGTWHPAIEVPGTAALNWGGDADALSVSCAPGGICAVAGTYVDGSGHSRPFVASGRDGAWHPAIEVPGTARAEQERQRWCSVDIVRPGGYLRGRRHLHR